MVLAQSVVDRFIDGLPSMLRTVESATIKLAILFMLIGVGYGIGWLLRAGYNALRRSAPTSGSIMAGKAVILVFIVMMAGLGLTRVYNVDLLSLFATLGIVSLALGFGLQNTVANLAAGVALSLDKPFQVGDRIRVGTTWGDVTSIGLRSTRIKTTSGEVVAIPNAVLDTQEVWNNTHHGEGEIRVELAFGISYSSSIQLAEGLVLRAARRHPHVQAFPEPVVQVKRFGDNAVEMELRAWVDDARLRPRVADDLFRAIKKSFDEEGVQFPFPQRTISRAEDLAAPAPTPEELHEDVTQRPLVMVCTRSAPAARAMAERVVDFVSRLGGRMIVLHVRPQSRAYDRADADHALNHYLAVAHRRGVLAKARAEVGDFVPILAGIAKEEGAKLIVFGQSQKGRFTSWLRQEIQGAVKATGAPVLPLPTDIEVDDAFVERWRSRITDQPT